MSATLEFTGERFVPGTTGAIAYEHGHRYAFALRYARGRRVLDAACGEGYGTALLATVAASAIGVDISDEAVAHARDVYATADRMRFECASVTALPIADASIDLVVSFETIEHLPAEDQPRMLAEFARVLTPEGVLVLSSPNRRRYSDERNYRNPFHLHELYRDELTRLLEQDFPVRRWHHQLPIYASAIWSEAPAPDAEAWVGDGRSVRPAPTPDGIYHLVVAAKRSGPSPASGPHVSLFTDSEDSERTRAEAAHAEVLRLDALLHEREAALAQQTAHIHHLEELVLFRERLIEERDAQLAACNALRESHEKRLNDSLASLAALREDGTATKEAAAASHAALGERETALRAAQQENARLEAAIGAQERIIAYRQSVQWWFQLPWVRARSWWQRLTGR